MTRVIIFYSLLALLCVNMFKDYYGTLTMHDTMNHILYGVVIGILYLAIGQKEG